jgi:hypothetical protein
MARRRPTVAQVIYDEVTTWSHLSLWCDNSKWAVGARTIKVATCRGGPKRLELAHELMSSATDVALVVNANKPTVLNIENGMQAAVRSLGLRLHVLHAGSDTDIEAAFAGFVQLEAGVLVITMTERLAKLATRHAVPTIFQYPEFTAAGGC